MRRILALTLVLCILSLGFTAQAGWTSILLTNDESIYVNSLFPPISSSENFIVSGYYHFRLLEDETAEIVEYSGKEVNLIIPQTLNGYAVTGIADYAFAFNIDINTLHLPEGLQHIGIGAFGACLNLTDIYFPNSLISISDKAFALCLALENIQLPMHLNNISDTVFYECNNLKNIDFQFSNNQVDNNQKCPHCIGGWIDCTVCETFGICLRCDGIGHHTLYTSDGWVYEECDYCMGSGQCSKCDTYGFWECAYCHGTGILN